MVKRFSKNVNLYDKNAYIRNPKMDNYSYFEYKFSISSFVVKDIVLNILEIKQHKLVN